MPEKRGRLRGVMIGAGYFSWFHLDAWQRIEDVDLVALCDLNLDQAVARAGEFGIARTYSDYRQMLDRERPDFVDIVTRPDTHLELCLEAAARGVAIICQKPLAPSWSEAQQLVTTVAAQQVPCMVHENFRFQPWHREMKRLIEAGTIGHQLLAINVCCRMGDGWQPDAYLGRQPYFRTMPRLLIYETGVHFIDTFRYLVGEIEAVYAHLQRRNQAIAGEDSGVVVLEFQSGAQGLIAATRYHESECDNPRYTFGEFVVDGSDGTLRLDGNGVLTIHPLGQPPVIHDYAHRNHSFAGDSVWPTQQHFVEQLLGDRHFETGGREYLKTLAVQEAIYQSAERQARVCVEDVNRS